MIGLTDLTPEQLRDIGLSPEDVRELESKWDVFSGCDGNRLIEAKRADRARDPS
jgi:hypothetical protein